MTSKSLHCPMVSVACSALALVGAVWLLPAQPAQAGYLWSTGGVYDSSDGPSELTSGNVLQIDDGGAFGSYGFTTDIGSTVLWTGGNLGFVYAANGSVVNGGTWNAVAATQLVLNGSQGGVFSNNGTFESTGAGGLEVFQLPFTNSSGGTIGAAPGTTLSFVNETGSAGVTTFDDHSAFGSGGTVSTNGATFYGLQQVQAGTTLMLNPGTFFGTGTGGATLSGATTWVGNSSTGSVMSGTWTVATGSVLMVTGSGVTFSGTSPSGTGGGSFTNAGTINVTSTGLLNISAETLTNQGLLKTTASTSLNGSNATFVNSGLLQSAGGTTLGVNAGGSFSFVNASGGTIEATAATDAIQFSGLSYGATKFNDGSNYAGAGTIAIGYHGATFSGTQDIAAATHVVFQSGIYDGLDAVLNGNASWVGNSTFGSAFAGNWTLSAGSTLTQSGGGTFGAIASGGTFVNNGTLAWTTAFNAGFAFSDRVTNNGSVVFSAAAAMVDGGSGGGSFTNAGLFGNAGGGTVTVSTDTNFTFHNSGTNGSLPAGTINTALASDTVAFTSSANSQITFGDGTRYSGLGKVQIGGAGASFSGAQNVASGTSLSFAAGTYSGSGATLLGSAAWSGGSFVGGWTVAPGSVLTANAGASKLFSGAAGSSFVIAGTIAWTSANAFFLSNHASVGNAGIFDVSADASLADGGNGGTFVNSGLFEKTGGTGTTSIAPNGAATFVNAAGGTVKVMSGTIALGNFVNDGTLTGTARFTGNVTNNGRVTPGDAPGILTLAGNFTQGASGTLDIGLGNADVGLLAVTGSAVLGGTIEIDCYGACTFGKGTEIRILTATTLAGGFTNIVQHGFTGTDDFSLVSLPNGEEILLNNSVEAAVPEPDTAALLLCGGAILAALRRRLSTGSAQRSTLI